MEEALVAYLLAESAITALTGTRVHWNEYPQGAPLPGLVLTRITGVRDYHYTGASGLVDSRVQIDTRAETYAGAVTLARLVRDRLSGFADTVSGIRFDGLRLTGEGHHKDRPTGATGFHRVSMDFEFFHDE